MTGMALLCMWPVMWCIHLCCRYTYLIGCRCEGFQAGQTLRLKRLGASFTLQCLLWYAQLNVERKVKKTWWKTNKMHVLEENSFSVFPTVFSFVLFIWKSRILSLYQSMNSKIFCVKQLISHYKRIPRPRSSSFRQSFLNRNQKTILPTFQN